MIILIYIDFDALDKKNHLIDISFEKKPLSPQINILSPIQKEVCFKEPTIHIITPETNTTTNNNRGNSNNRENSNYLLTNSNGILKNPNRLKTTIKKNLLIPNSIEEKASNILSETDYRIYEQNLHDIDLILKQFNNIGYEKDLDSGEQDELNEDELNNSLDIPIEENESQTDTDNLDKILIDFEVF